ncbi:carbohydrate ABC transporter permease [Rathayibacter sp. Leaf248]|uniref:carbohydrate ABC transporter permease n=1 Tax=Rathayibacter sp. Leaf248 TaxID=2876555 RepID=UPI001E2EFB9B|nr:sugar ABC transporter permease [Rathayibacter sp. Leaf248]
MSSTSTTTRRPFRADVARLGFAAPGGVLLAALSLYPIYLLVRMSVSQVSSGTLNGDWPLVGVENFAALFQGPDLGGATLRTATFVILVTAVGVIGGLGAAIALRSSRFGSAFLLGMMVFIWAMPPVVNGSIWKFLLADQGLINILIRATGISAEGVPFLYDSRFALLSVAVVNAWAVIPFNALVFRSALLGIDPEILEAASVDGASRWQEVRDILVPAARPTAVILAILTVVYAFRSFDFIYVMTAGGPGDVTSTLPYLSYSQAFVEHDYGMGSATGLIALVIVAVLAVVYVRSTRSES